MVKKKDLDKNNINDYGEFFRCKRCLYEMTGDDFGETKMGKQYTTCKTCREKEKEYRKNNTRKPRKQKEKKIEETTEEKQDERHRNHSVIASPEVFEQNYLSDFYISCPE